ncbi:MAG: hypothetical protein IJZ77_04865 [Bacilli bacterium]|nr:hypothetical protein [Bacilli bacterium]
MKNRHVAVVVFCVGFSVVCFIWGVLWMAMCLDYKEQVSRLEQDLIDYKWQLEQVDQMICIKE